MGELTDIGIDASTFRRIGRIYRRTWSHVRLTAATPDGGLVYGDPGCPCKTDPDGAAWRRHAIAEAVRWGEPTISFCPHRRLIWAVPLMRNQDVLGGLVAGTAEEQVFPDDRGQPRLDLRRAAADLLRLAERENLTNAALLEARRVESNREQRRAEAIHEAKALPHLGIRQMYLREEPELLAAIRRDDRSEARTILNRILAAIHHRAGQRLDLIKSFFMELVVTMCRTAVESGGNPEELFGQNYRSIADLGQIDSEERLAPWLHEMLERNMDSIRQHYRQPHAVIASAALKLMEQRYGENISRDDVAEALGLSGSHLSRLLREQTGQTFTDLLGQIRVNRSAELLIRTDKPLALIALECGFNDQSYFTKVFRKYRHTTPRQFRLDQGTP